MFSIRRALWWPLGLVFALGLCRAPDSRPPAQPMTGDRLADVGFDLNGFQLQDEACLFWLSKQPPSIAINGQYTYLGTVTRLSLVC